MLQSLARRIDGAASWRRLGLLVLAYAGLVFVLSSFEARIKVCSGGLGVPDLMHGFSAAELYARLEAFGAEGRRLYVFAELVDLVYPIVYASGFALALALATRALFPAASLLRLLCLLPYGVMLADFLENACFFAVLLAWPAHIEAAATLAGAFNLVKWSLFALVLPLVLLGLMGLGIRALRRRGSPAGRP